MLIYLDANSIDGKISTDINECELGKIEEKYPKLKGLLEIIHGCLPENARKINRKYKNLMYGTLDKSKNKKVKTKVLVFAKFQSTLDIIQNYLNEKGVNYMKLHGTSAEKIEQIDIVKNNPIINVLLLMTSADCAGLNIQFITDCIFMHNFNSIEVESQCIGRCQRLGRAYDSPLQVHYLLYSNEIS